MFSDSQRFSYMRWWTNRNKSRTQTVCGIHNSGKDLFLHPFYFPPGLTVFNDPIQLNWFSTDSTHVGFQAFHIIHCGFLCPTSESPVGYTASVLATNLNRSERFSIRPGYSLFIAANWQDTFSSLPIRMIALPEKVGEGLHVMI